MAKRYEQVPRDAGKQYAPRPVVRPKYTNLTSSSTSLSYRDNVRDPVASKNRDRQNVHIAHLAKREGCSQLVPEETRHE